VIHLWNLIADASARGNALYQPLRADGGMPVREVLDRAELTASDILVALDTRTPRRLGILMENGEPWLRGAFAASRLDAAFVPLPLPVGFVGADAYAEHIARIVTGAGLDAILVDSTLSRAMGARIARALNGVALIDITEPVSTSAPATVPGRGDDALAIIQYTSGSRRASRSATATSRWASRPSPAGSAGSKATRSASGFRCSTTWACSRR
jgi:acyl-CoA synthetase (AMP-forming)/AMP-acid ligase II